MNSNIKDNLILIQEVAKTSTPEMKQELMELSRIIQDAAVEAQK